MSDQVIGVTIKGIGDFSDVVSNVGSVQKALTKLKLPDKLGDSLNKNISNFMKEYDKYQKKIAEGIHTQGDQNAVNKSLNSMLNSYEKIIKDFSKISEKDFKDIFNLDSGAFKKFQQQLKAIEADFKKIKLDPKALVEPISKIKELTSAKRLFGNGTGFDKLTEAFNTNDLLKAKEAIQEIDGYLARFGSKMKPEKLQDFQNAWGPLKTKILDADAGAEELYRDFNRVNQAMAELGGQGSRELQDMANGLRNTDDAAKSVVNELKQLHANEFSFNRQASDISRQIQQYFGLTQIIRKVGDIAKDAFQTVKELDEAMTQTAVVTNFSVGDMWDMLPTYTQQANQLGSTIKDVYEAATLYYQQGLNTNQAMALANETLKMARIAGLDAADATNMMTAALRGFNMEINQTSAQKINDVYSELAAITASDTREIGSAMERTASIANAANMEFSTTSAFLAQMIETTREAPENLGTAMKTIVARFQEMKQDPTKLIDSEGVAMDANKVDKALKTIGVQLLNTKGEFRDLDDVFLDIASRWDSLTQGQQRYIATIAAGSRQQSRFIAMMSNYERTMELVDAANNSAGASQRQFEKTLDSMEAKLNKLKNAWDQFTMGLMNNQILKFGVDRLTDAFTIVNKFIDILGKIPPKPFEGVTKSILTLVSTLGLLKLGGKGAMGLTTGVFGWAKGEGFGKSFKAGWDTAGSGGKQKSTRGQFEANVLEAKQAGAAGANAYAMAWKQVFPKAGLKDSIYQALKVDNLKSNIQSNTAQGLLETLLPKDQISAAAKDQFQYYIKEFQAGNISKADMPALISGSIEGIDQNDITEDMLNKMANMPDPTVKLNEGFGRLSTTLSSAGSSLQMFGSILQGTPFEPVGKVLMTLGSTLTAFSGILAGTKMAFMENWAAALGMATGEEAVTFASIQATIATQGLTAGVASFGAALWATLWPILAIAAVIGTVVGTYKLLDAAIETDKEKLEAATDAAAAASEAYDSAKQETSELADAIEQIKTNEDAFDGLAVGTAAFNEQLVTANEQIMELIKKYPILNDYLTTDKNGLMHISDEGLNAVKEYQKQKQANASALNLIQAADLNSEETYQKAKQMRKSKWAETAPEIVQRQKEADLLEQQADAQKEMAKINAINTALVDKEINNREKVSSILASQYDTRKEAISLEGESIHDLKQEYADFYGYNYNKSTKKLTDIEGNEIDIDSATVKDAIKEIRVITDIEVDAKSLDGMIHTIDSRFSKSLGESFKDSAHLFSDILSDDINVSNDLLNDLLSNPDKLNEAVNSLSEKEIAAVLGVSEEMVAADTDTYKTELTNKLTEKAQNIAETQAQAYTDLAGMLAQTMGTSHFDELGNVVADITDSNKQIIQKRLSNLTEEQKNLLSSIGTILRDNVGAESMKTFLDQATDIYTSGHEKAITDLNNTIKEVNWDSPIARLKVYNDMIADGLDPSVQNLGQSLLDSTDSANLLGEAFEEFYDSSDFQDLAENMDNFVDSSGRLDASSIQEMAKQCGSLNKLLDTGAISAGGVAAALNALGTDGNLTILDLNKHLLEFLSTANQLDDVLSEAHGLIEGFNWGLDEGEAEDFAIDASKKWAELYGNGEYGNSQLENYAKFVLGEERWIDALKDHGGNIEDALADLDKDISVYSEGFEQAWIDMADSTESKFSDVHYGSDGDIIWETRGRTTEELVDWLAETRGITKEWAKLMVEDFANYSYDFKTELASNDFNAGLDKYLPERTNAEGQLVMTAGELKALADAQGTDREGILQEIADYKNISVEELEKQLNILENIDENGQALLDEEDIKQLNEDYSKAELGQDTSASWLTQYQKMNGNQGQENTVELKSAITGAISDGFEADQATEMARNEALELFNSGMDVFYDGVQLQAEDLADAATFADKIAQITDNSRWNQVGQAIAEGVISYLFKGKNKNQNKDEKTGDGTSRKDGGTGFQTKTTTSSRPEVPTVEDKEVTYTFHSNDDELQDTEETTNNLEVAASNPFSILVEAYYPEAAQALDMVKQVQTASGKGAELKVSSDNSKLITTQNLLSNLAGKVFSTSLTVATGNTLSTLQSIWNVLSNIISNKNKVSGTTSRHTGAQDATGTHNHGYFPAPTFGSAAKGYGQIGPKGKGGLTLTGELGYEIAWLPDENRSVILGANGPQMIDLPGNAVVWTHEQSKKILQQKAIPAGSHAGRNIKKTVINTSSGGGGGNNNGNNNGNENNDAAVTVIQVAGKVEVWWENMARRVDATQKKIDNNQKTFENQLKKFGTTTKSISKTIAGYRKNLKTSIALNKQEVKKAKDELRAIEKGTNAFYSQHQVSYEVTTKDNQNNEKKETRQFTVDLKNFIQYNKKYGTYEIDYAALDKVALGGWKNGKGEKQSGNKSLAEAIKQLAEKEINDRLSKKKTAEDNIAKAREELKKLADDVYETFYRWEKSITQVYILSQKLEQLNSRLTTASSQAELQYSKLLAGVTDSVTALPQILSALANQKDLMTQRVNAAQANVEATLTEYQNSISLKTYQDIFDQAKKTNKGVVSTEAANDLRAAKQAITFFKRANGNYEAAVQALNAKNISGDEYEAIKKVLDDIYSKQNAFLDAQNDAYGTIQEIYDTIEEYQSYIAEFESSLLSGLKKEAENQIKQLDKLNSSLTKAYKELLDEVKRKLDERRKQEDNIKTEQDISRKQQRLAALRADTSGGHQVEIVQLEKEIAEAQQNYQRNLEDQLLDKLQQQADIAEQQRQRQIELLEGQKEIAESLGTNLEQVKLWLTDTEKYYEDIKNAWLENNGFSDATLEEQKQLLEQFELAWAKYQSYTQTLPTFIEIAGKRLADVSDNTAAQVGSLTNAENYLSDIAKDLSILRTYGMTVSEAVAQGYTNKEIHDAGYTAKEFKAGIPEATIKDAMKAGYKHAEAAAAYGAKEALTTGNISGATTQKATGASAKDIQQIINSDTSDDAVQSDLARVKLDKFDTNGSKKGGTILSGAQLSDTGKSVGAHRGSTFYWQDWDEKTGKLTGNVKSWTIDKLPAKYVGAQADARQALIYAIKHQEIGSIINKNMEELVNSSDVAKKAFIGKSFTLKGGYTANMSSKGNLFYEKDGTVYVWNPSTGANKVYKKYDKKTYLTEAKKNGNTSAVYARALIKRKAYTKTQLEKEGVVKFAKGGLASYTGPAWLDGTPSKPELVLNAADTKNFLMLKDVLSKALGSTNSVTNSYAGNATYEININVDKLSSDYDVDKVAERVKKIIVKDSGYRNVTQVRNFR